MFCMDARGYSRFPWTVGWLVSAMSSFLISRIAQHIGVSKQLNYFSELKVVTQFNISLRSCVYNKTSSQRTNLNINI